MSTPRFGRFSVFFPMWNEEEYLQRALNAATELGEELLAAGTVGDYEMIIVNDASTDATPRLADEAARLQFEARLNSSRSMGLGQPLPPVMYTLATHTGEQLHVRVSGTLAAWQGDRKSTRLNSSHSQQSRMPSSA